MDLAAILPVAQAAKLDVVTDARWMIESLWTHQAVGIIGGAPKCCKSWFGLDMAVSVASHTACLGHYEVHAPGRALVYLAEDALPQVRDRIAGLCKSRALELRSIDVHVITAPALRLDLEEDQRRLMATVATHKPVFLLLDPLVRLHRLDENSSADIASLLGFLREVQRTHGTAIALVHHMSKKRRAALGQALRGSGDIHAWADSSAYLVRGRNGLMLNLEHRAAPASEPVGLRLAEDDVPRLTVTATEEHAPKAMPLSEALRRVFATAETPLTRAVLRRHLRVNNARLGEALTTLENDNHIERVKDGWIVRRAAHHALPL